MDGRREMLVRGKLVPVTKICWGWVVVRDGSGLPYSWFVGGRTGRHHGSLAQR